MSFPLSDLFVRSCPLAPPAGETTAMIGPLIAVFAAVAALVIYGLFAWERIVRRRREQDPGST